MKQRCLFSLERTTEKLEWREPQTISWLVMNAPVFLGSLLYWNEPKATLTKSFPRSGLAYDSQPRHVQSNSWTLQSWAEKNAEPDKPRKKGIWTIIIFYTFASVLQWNTALAWHEWETRSFLLDAAEKAALESKAPVVFVQPTFSPNLLLSQLGAEAEPASQEGTGRITFSHPSCLEWGTTCRCQIIPGWGADLAAAAGHENDVTSWVCDSTWCQRQGSRRLHTTTGKKQTFSLRNSPWPGSWLCCWAIPLGRAQHGTPSRLVLATALSWL